MNDIDIGKTIWKAAFALVFVGIGVMTCIVVIDILTSIYGV